MNWADTVEVRNPAKRRTIITGKEKSLNRVNRYRLESLLLVLVLNVTGIMEMAGFRMNPPGEWLHQ